MHRDTIIGIVGAVVLVGVMVAVFAYEYNQSGTQTTPGEEEEVRFEDRYIGLNATEDLDADGTPNAQDDDFDGDGIPNGNDTAAATRARVEGTVGTGPNAPAVTGAFFAGSGAVHIQGFVNYTLPAPAPVGTGFTLLVRLLDPSGELAATGSATIAAGEDEVSVPLEVTDVQAGNYTLEVARANQAGASPQATPFVAEFDIHYHYTSPDPPLEK